MSIAEAFSYPDHRSTSGTDYQGLVGLRTRAGLQLDLDASPRLAGARGRLRLLRLRLPDQRARRVHESRCSNSYEWDADVGELWVEGPLLPALDLKLGRQVVNWGRSDTLRVLDVLNPVDNREPGLLDLVDLRLPVGMAKLSYYPHPRWSVTGIAIPEIRFSIDPALRQRLLPGPGCRRRPRPRPAASPPNTRSGRPP